MTMKLPALLLFASLPLVVGRLGDRIEGGGDGGVKKLQENAPNETFFATNEVSVSRYPCSQRIDSLQHSKVIFSHNDHSSTIIFLFVRS